MARGYSCGLTFELSRPWRQGALADENEIVRGSWRPGRLAGAGRLERRVRPCCRVPAIHSVFGVESVLGESRTGLLLAASGSTANRSVESNRHDRGPHHEPKGGVRVTRRLCFAKNRRDCEQGSSKDDEGKDADRCGRRLGCCTRRARADCNGCRNRTRHGSHAQAGTHREIENHRLTKIHVCEPCVVLARPNVFWGDSRCCLGRHVALQHIPVGSSQVLDSLELS